MNQSENKIYEKLKGPIGRYNELKISVDYYLGGMNYFNGQTSKRGIYLHLTPIIRNGGMSESTLLGGQRESGFKVLLEELSRRSQKKIDLQFNKIKKVSKQISSFYYDDKNQEIFNIIKY